MNVIGGIDAWKACDFPLVQTAKTIWRVDS